MLRTGTMARDVHRRRFLSLSGVAGVSGLAGCLDTLGGGSGRDDERAGSTRTEEGPETATAGPDGTSDPSGGEDASDRPRPLETVRDVCAHYYPWYGAPAHDYRDGRWSLESPSTPVLGDYDSTDPEVIERHIGWCHAAGIRWLNVSWWGPDSHEDERFRNDLLEHPWSDELDWSILYETVGRLGSDADMDDRRARRRLRDDLVYLADTYFYRDVYKRIDGRPVLYVYSAQGFGGDVVGAYDEAIDAAGVRPYLVADVRESAAIDAAAIAEVADAVTTYNPYTPREDVERIFLDRLETSYRSWYLARDHTDLDVIPTVIPGMNDSEVTHVYRDNPVLESSPERYERVATISRRYADGPVFVTSFNEWYENTQIEPSEEFGERYLELTADVLATGERDPPAIEGEALVLAFGRTVPESELNPDASRPRDLAMLVNRLVVYDDGGAKVDEIDVGGDEGDALFLVGAYDPERAGDDTWRWFGGGTKTVLHLPELPGSGTLEVLGSASAEMSLEVVINGSVRGEGTVSPDHDVYTISYG